MGTASLRRQPSCSRRGPTSGAELHGNVDTRLRKLAEGELDAIVLAVAGLRRLGRADEIAFPIPEEAMTPAPGQGSLLLQIRDGDEEAPRRSTRSSTKRALRELTAERTVSPCSAPAAPARSASTAGSTRRDRMRLDAFIGLPDGSEWVRDRVEGDSTEPTALGAELAQRLIGAGARELLDRAEELAHELPGRFIPLRVKAHRNDGAGGSCLPGRRRAGRPRSDDGAIAGADRLGRRDLLRPADPAGSARRAREDAELVYVGKAPGVPSVPQEEIGERLIEAARAGKSVVRLKGGDPFVFGRGGEEGEALRAAGVEFELVPGITAGVAASAYAGIPVTHRDDASAVAFVTGHEDPEKEESALDWEALARFPGTLVFYMGVKRLGDNAAALIAAWPRRRRACRRD